MVPLEWASGVVPKPDPTVINKHIRKLVDVSIWKNLLAKENNGFDTVIIAINLIRGFQGIVAVEMNFRYLIIDLNFC